MTAPERPGLKPAALLLGASPKVAEQWVQSGHIVLAVEPRPTPAGTESIKSPYLGVFNLLSLRAFLVGRTLVGMRLDDAIHALDWLCARKDVDRSAISVYGEGASGMVALHAAVLDSRIHAVTVEKTLAAYRMIVDEPLHRNVSEVVIPGVLRKYDVCRSAPGGFSARDHYRGSTGCAGRRSLAGRFPQEHRHGAGIGPETGRRGAHPRHNIVANALIRPANSS